jgi:hypothetical protein
MESGCGASGSGKWRRLTRRSGGRICRVGLGVVRRGGEATGRRWSDVSEIVKLVAAPPGTALRSTRLPTRVTVWRDLTMTWGDGLDSGPVVRDWWVVAYG